MVAKPLSVDDPAAPAAPAPRPPDAPRDGWDEQPTNDSNAWVDAAHDGGRDTVPRDHVPAALRPGRGPLSPAVDDDDADSNVWDEARNQPSDASDKLAHIPDALKPGGGGANRLETNPFLKRKPLPQTQDGPSPTPPVDSFARLDLVDAADQASNPWQPPSESHSQKASSGYQTPQKQPMLLDDHDVDADPWAASEPPPPPPPAKQSPALLSLPSDEGSAWNDDVRPDQAKIVVEPPTPAPATLSNDLLEEQNVWDDLGSLDKGKSKVADASPKQRPAQIDDWNLIDVDSPSDPPNQPDAAEPADKNPPLPPRDSERPRWVPSREPVDGKSETYQVKNIRWHDDTSSKNPRTSPILIQNKNGPCPLVALVNALTLTTPADIPDTALVQVLRSREQISLNLLLDAVFDELMSPRRTSSEDALPDVGDLYGFLQSLHTGMNVNPRFIPTPEMVTAYKRTSLTHLHPTERGELIPGTFENTMEMSLYATFSIPLIHGWLAPRSEPVYEALERQAASYEEVQNLLFREEELEDKLSNSESGLTEAEQQLYQDIITIKIFLHESATQLTPWGIEVIGKAMRPGTFAILFRNDHFSTLYCHPQTMQLLSLVTDAGYGSHDEVVWESLMDVNGEQTEYLSGDFRVVGGGGGGSAVPGSSSGATDHGGEWTTVQGKRGKGRQQEDEAPMSPQHEQEDRDLALALQLQEEEDERHREEQARRRRESILSEQYIEQQGQRPGPVNRNHRRTQSGTNAGLAPERRSSNSVNVPVVSASQSQTRLPANAPPAQQVRPLVPPRRQPVSRAADAEGEDAPPSYEQAAHDRAFVPPAGHPSHAGSSPVASRQTSRTSSTGQPQQPPRPVAMGSPTMGRRMPVTSGPPPAVHQGRDRECVVM
ncbi:DUF455 domain protein [Purpureocillium lavendulum]|uniref:DUF455 domain protein n=1 Tax=Purpureocillium lavendulum TaxID=1247861 RepID=A0AB34FKW4_9HYPO|nr:DUF455 domain protein [Purpureocillium lavendulum]